VVIDRAMSGVAQLDPIFLTSLTGRSISGGCLPEVQSLPSTREF